MTEDEAKTKWCPMVGKGPGIAGADAKCIASDCMMWQWVWDGNNQQKTNGFCGLSVPSLPPMSVDVSRV